MLWEWIEAAWDRDSKAEGQICTRMGAAGSAQELLESVVSSVPVS